MLAFTGISAILGLIDAFTFFSMDNKSFDIKYNRDFLRVLPKKDVEKPEGVNRMKEILL